VARTINLETNLGTQPQYLRLAHESLFALNIALVAQLEGNQKPNKLFSLLEYGELELRLKINGYFHLHPHSDVGANVAFLAYSLGLALLIFLLLRISSRTFAAQQFLRLAGIVSVLALPVSWLYLARQLGWLTIFSSPLRYLLVVELLVAAVSALLYLYIRWPLPAWGSVGLLLLHFGFWEAVCFGPYFWLGPVQSVVTLAGLCSSLAWGIYVSRERSMHLRFQTTANP
jgi:hypothetical protein